MRTALTLVLLAALSLAATAQERAAVIATDYTSTGYAAGLNLSAPWTVGPLPGEPVHHDAVARWHDDLLYVINRGGADNVQVLDPAQNFDTVRQFSLGLGRNIQDIAFDADGTAFVSCYDEAELLHIDPETGAILHVIATDIFADSDGLPETGWLLRRDGRLFVTCQRLDRDNWYSPVGDSYLLVLDTVTRTWIDCDPALAGTQGILLSMSNPYTAMDVDGDHIVLGCVSYYGMQDGGVEVVDPETLVSLGAEITEADLGGDLVDLVVTGDGRAAIVADASWVTHVKLYNPGGGAVVTIHSGVAYDHADLAFDGDFQLVVADRRLGSAGLRVFDVASGGELTTGPVDTGLPPSFVALPGNGGVVAVGDLPAGPLSLSAPWPNPANPMTQLAFSARAGQVVTLRLVDLRGREVRRARVTTDADGHGVWAFDGRDRQGRAVASGVYRCVMQTPSGMAARSFTIVR